MNKIPGVFDEFHNFECNCTSDAHRLSFRLQDANVGHDDMVDLDAVHPDEIELYVSIFLNDYQSWWQRVWVAIKYVFGYKCRYGHWDSWNLRHEDADRMIAMITKYKELRIKYQELRKSHDEQRKEA